MSQSFNYKGFTCYQAEDGWAAMNEAGVEVVGWPYDAAGKNSISGLKAAIDLFWKGFREARAEGTSGREAIEDNVRNR